MQCREAGGPLSNPPSFEWNKMRLFKRKGKRYEVVIPCQPYSTIVIGTDDAKFGGIAYTPGG